MTKKEAFNIGLPKWTQCVITGDRVTKEQAMNIIRRTDDFFFGYDGNNHDFNDAARKIVGMPVFDIYAKHTPEERKKYSEDCEEFNERSNLIGLNYLNNAWISSAWIGGTHGWCSPEGEIGYQNNVGKWSTVEDIYDDLKTIGENFPYINLTCTLVNEEESSYDENTKTLVTMKLKNGKVRFINPIPLEKLKYGGVKCDFSTPILLCNENYFSLSEIKKWWGVDNE